MWCHAHGPPSQPAVSPAASPTFVQRSNLPNATRRSALNATSVPKTEPATPAAKPYSTAINATCAALIGSVGVNTAAAMSAATPPATAPPSALRPPTIATAIPRGEFTATRRALIGEPSFDQVMFLPIVGARSPANAQVQLQAQYNHCGVATHPKSVWQVQRC